MTLYPPIQSSEKETADTEGSDTSLAEQAAEAIAKQIAGWLKEGRALASTATPEQPARALSPSDILILLRQRAPLMEPLLQALSRHTIPCAGVDRFMLSEHLAVRDMLALVAFACDTSDDMALACVLASPLYEVPYDALTLLCTGREEKTLWQFLCEDETYAVIQSELATFYECRKQGRRTKVRRSTVQTQRVCPLRKPDGGGGPRCAAKLSACLHAV